jgi:hypothetical protein
VHVCIYVYLYVCMYVCTYLCLSLSIYIYRYGRMQAILFRVWQKSLDTLYSTFLHYYQVTFVPSGMKPKATWPVIFLMFQVDNQNSYVALSHVLLNEWLAHFSSISI